MDKTYLDRIPGLDDEDKRRFANAIDRADRARAGHGLTYAGFFDPRQQALLRPVLDRAGYRYLLDTGAAGEADRAVFLFLPDYYEGMDLGMLRELEEYPLAAVEIKVTGLRQSGKELSHRDYLGTLMGLGIRRETIGDLFPTESGCTFAAMQDVVGHITASLDKVSSPGATTERCGFERLIPTPSQVKGIKSTVASLRLDSVIAEAFSVSRSDAQDAIRRGLVSVNYLECRSVSEDVSQGDILRWQGKGKAKLVTCGGLSRKGNTIVVIHRYV